MNELEWQTRVSRINTRLKALDPKWKIVRHKEGMDLSGLHQVAVEELPTTNGPVDYALFVDGKLLGMIEAKKVGVGPQNVLEQTKRYAKGVEGVGNWNGLHVPFLYATNGELIYFLDARQPKPTSREIAEFHTADALAELFERNEALAFDRLRSHANDIDGLRPYQKQAIADVETALAGGQRNVLVAMATGTGKTRSAVSLLYRLLEAKVARRILFLVDRKALAAQTVGAFASFNTPHGNKFDKEYEVYSQKFRLEDLDEDLKFDPKALPPSYLTHPNDTQTYVAVSTIQRMARLLLGKEYTGGDPDGGGADDDADRLPMPIHCFDVIVVDESHRGYSPEDTKVYQKVVNHFDAIKIALTATPTSLTYDLYGKPVFRYTTEEAVLDGWLVDYDAVRVRSNVRINGAFLRPGERVEIVDLKTGAKQLDFLEDERHYDSSQLEKDITAPESTRLIVEELAKHAKAFEDEHGRFPKTLIFAANDLQHRSHADAMIDACRKVFNRGDEFVKKITGSSNVDRPLQRIREFRNRPEPGVVVTVDMLTTGVDIPALEFLVFMRPVKSRVLWEQMLGRGTRLCHDISKSKFVVFDCFDGTLIEYFRNASEQVFEPKFGMGVSDTIPEIIEKIFKRTDLDYDVGRLVKRLRRIEKDMSGEAVVQFADFIDNGDIGKFAAELPSRIAKDFLGTMKLLRSYGFQDLLCNYPRSDRAFVIAGEVRDEVSSEVVFRVGEKTLRPKDYLVAFSEFVKSNQDSLDAMKILFKRPKDWSYDAVEELRTKLRTNHFKEESLAQAHHLVYGKALADIISMVRHAAMETEPILSAVERASQATAKVKKGQVFDAEQTKWLEYIEAHLAQSLSLSPEDFDLMPVFSNRGGLPKAKRVFGDRLPHLIRDINYAFAA